MQDLCSQRNGSAAVGSRVWNENKGTLKDSLLNSIPEANCTGAVSAQNSIPSSVILSSNYSGVKGTSDNNASSPINAHLESSLSSLSQTGVPAAEAASHGVGASTVCRSYEYDNSQYSNSQSAQFFPIVAGQSHFASSPAQRVDSPAIGNIACDRTQGSSVNKSLNQIPHLGAKDAHSETCAGNSNLQQATFLDKPNNYLDMQVHVQRKMDSNSRYNNNDMTTSSHSTNSVNAGFVPNTGNCRNNMNGVHSNNNLQFGANLESNNQNSLGAQFNNAANSRAKNQSSNCESNFNSPYSGWPGLNTSTSVPSSNGWIVSSNLSSHHDTTMVSKDADKNMAADNELSYSNLVGATGGTENEDQQQQNTGKDMSWGLPSRLGDNSGSNGWNNQCPVTSSGSNSWNNRQNNGAISSSGDNSDVMDNQSGFPGLIGATGGTDYPEGKQNGGNNFKQESSRPLPPRLGLLGGGESSLNATSTGWGNSGTTGNGNTSWAGGGSRTNNGPTDMPGNNSGMSPPKPHNSWAQAAGKGLNPTQSSGNNGHDSSSSNSDVRGDSSDGNSSKPQADPISELKAKAAVTEGWGQTPINQDAPWDLPPSPPSTKDPVLKEPPPSTPVWRAPVNNGTEIWENNLRMNKGVPPPVTTAAPPWGHTPSTNIGGHWGDDDVSSNVWSGAPQSNPGGSSNWSEPKVQNAMWSGNNNPPTPIEKHWSGNNQGREDWEDGVMMPDEMHYPLQRQNTVGNWSPVSTPKKEVPPSGWELPSPPTNRRPPMTNYDDGTAAWGNPQRQGKVSHWKDMPSAKPIMNSNNNMGGNPSMMQAMSNNIQVSGPGMIRLPSGATVTNKNDMEAMWNKSGNRNSRWQEMPSHDGPNIGTWGEESMHMSNSKNMQGNNMTGNNTGWGDQQNNSSGYWGGNNPNKKNNNNWADGQVDTSSWLGPTKQGGKPLTRDLIWASKQFRLLIEHGFKREDAENALRNNNMNFNDALVELRTQMTIDGNMMDNDVFHGRKVRPSNLQEDMPMSENMFDLNFGGVHDSGFQPGGNFQGVGNIGACKPVKGSNNASSLLNSTLGGPQVAPGSINNFTPVFQKILQQQQQQPQPQVNLQQFALNMQQMNNPTMRTGQNNFPSNAQLRHLVQQIQMAVQAGHLNPNILHQALAPQTLQLLFQMLQQIKVLHQLQNAPKSMLGGSGSLQLNVQITQTKQRIINLQNQINAQQAIFLKQQIPIQPTQLHTPQGSNDLFKPNIESIPPLHNDFRDLSIKDVLLQTHQQSRLNQWKLPAYEKEENALCLSSNEFSRAPGPLSSKTTSASSSGPNLHPLLSQGDSAWSSLSRPQGESGWPESTTSSLTGIPDNSAGSNIPVSSTVPPNLGIGNNSGSGSLEPKEPSITPPSSGPSTTSASHTSYNLTDLVPEFEPGKPWKGMQMKNIEDDPHITPGSIARSPLSVNTNKDNLLWNPKLSSASTSGNDTSNSLVSNTWSFTQPNTTMTNSSSGLGNKSGNSKSNWSTNDSNTGTDMWGSKSRNMPPLMSGAQGKGEIMRERWEKQGNSAFLLLRNLTPQIDGSTLKTLCMQHGPLVLFHLSLNHGIALVRYSTKEEAAKAQSALNNCVLGNTTILADIPNDGDVPQYLVLLSSQNTPGGAYFPWSGSQQGNNSSSSTSHSTSARSSSNATYPINLPGGNSTNSVAGKQQESGGWNGNNLNMPSQLWPPNSNGLWGISQPISEYESSTNSSLNRFLPDDLLGGESM